MIKQLQKALNGCGESLVVDGIYGPKTKAALFRHPLMIEWLKAGVNDDHMLAYVFATAWHETAFTLQPVSEYGGEAYLKSKKYYPYYGRGYVQLTWIENYKKYGIADTPEKALEPEFAAYVMVDGMIKGIFTGKKLSDYFGPKKQDPINARRIINGTDKAHQIAGFYQEFLKLLS